MLAEGLNMPLPQVLFVSSGPPAWAPYAPCFKSRFLSFCLSFLSPFLLSFCGLLLPILLTGPHNMLLIILELLILLPLLLEI